jgi:hypothetical protein
MVLIHVPRPKNAYNPDRPVGSLLKNQVEHLREAETKLPARYRHRIDTYTNAIKTEGEAAAYIRKVTEAIHAAHADAERARLAAQRRRLPRRGTVTEIAAAATERSAQKRNVRKRETAKGKSARKESKSPTRSRKKSPTNSRTKSKPHARKSHKK